MTHRQVAALSIYASFAVALIPGYLFLGPQPHWHDPILLVALLAIATIAHNHNFRLTAGTDLDVNTAAGLIALAVAGPLPALTILLAPYLITWALGLLLGDALKLRHKPLLTVANLGNLASCGWMFLAGYAVLSRAGVQTLPHTPTALLALIAAGIAMAAVSFALTPCVYPPLWEGSPWGNTVRGAVRSVPAELLTIVLGSLAALLTGSLGVLGLAPFCVLVCAHQWVLARIARPESVGEMPRQAAFELFAQSMVLIAGGSRKDATRQVQQARLAFACRSEREVAARSAMPWCYAPIGWSELAGFMTSEHFDGSGPCSLRGEEIPRISRRLAVAEEWAGLTARGGPMLSFERALAKVQALSGSRFDPEMVAEMRLVVEREARRSMNPAPTPLVGRLPSLADVFGEARAGS